MNMIANLNETMKRGTTMKPKIPIIEMFTGLVSLWWAFVFLNGSMFDNVPELFAPIAYVGLENIWAFIFVFMAAMSFLGVLYKKDRLRRIGLTMNVFLYGVVCAGYIMKDPVHPETGVYFCVTLISLWGLREVRMRDA